MAIIVNFRMFFAVFLCIVHLYCMLIWQMWSITKVNIPYGTSHISFLHKFASWCEKMHSPSPKRFHTHVSLVFRSYTHVNTHTHASKGSCIMSMIHTWSSIVIVNGKSLVALFSCCENFLVSSIPLVGFCTWLSYCKIYLPETFNLYLFI